MKKVELYNITGQKLTEVYIKEEEQTRADGVQWGGKLYVWNHVHKQYREANIVPAILKSKK